MPNTSATARVQPQQRAGFIHFYNLEGRHFFSTVVPNTSPANRRVTIAACLQPGNPSSVRVGRTELPLTLESAMPYSEVGTGDLRGGCFAFGPLAGVYIIADDIAFPMIKPHEVAQLWMDTQHSLRSDPPAILRADKEA